MGKYLMIFSCRLVYGFLYTFKSITFLRFCRVRLGSFYFVWSIILFQQFITNDLIPVSCFTHILYLAWSPHLSWDLVVTSGRSLLASPYSAVNLESEFSKCRIFSTNCIVHCCCCCICEIISSILVIYH